MLNWMQDKMDRLGEAQQRLAAVEREMNAAFFERSGPIRSLVIASVIREHVMLLGPPGTGKSLLASTYSKAVADGSYFEILMTKFTTPEELLGGLAFDRVKLGKHERNMTNYAPEKRIWFLDEVWKASSAILNALLKALQERTVRNGEHTISIPLEMVVGASNEYPQDSSLQAMFDRFLFKHWVEHLVDLKHMTALWENGGKPKPVTARLQPGDMDILRDAVADFELSKAEIETLGTIKISLDAEGFAPSTRTWMKAMKVVTGSAVVNGRTSLIGPDFLVLADVLWNEDKDRQKLRAAIGNAADPYGSRAEAIIDGIRSAMHDLPDLKELTTGKKTRAEMINALSAVTNNILTERDKIQAIRDQAGAGHPRLDEADAIFDEADKQVKQLMHDVTMSREKRG